MRALVIFNKKSHLVEKSEDGTLLSCFVCYIKKGTPLHYLCCVPEMFFWLNKLNKTFVAFSSDLKNTGKTSDCDSRAVLF